MNDLKFRFRKKGKAEEELPQVFIDLGDYDIEDQEPPMGIRIVDVVRRNDVSSVRNQTGNGRMILVDVSMFEGDDIEKEGTVNDLKTVVHEIGAQLFTVNDSTALITTGGIVVDRVKSRKKA
ncbi:MAG: hypothetical protein WC067_00125 [Candidatus Methanomethylophilaceae archaeon]